MPTRIRYLSIEEVAAGMVLGAPLVVAEQGVTTFTLPAGHTLSESNLEQILQRNAEWVCVVEDDPRSEEERTADIQAIREGLDFLFSQADRSQPAIEALHAAVLCYRSL